jgi:hypothetical protein
MKKFLPFMILFSCLSGSLTAQDNQTKIREVGVLFNNTDNFGITFKKGSEKSLFRLSLLSMNTLSDNTKKASESYDKQRSIGFGINLGFENRKPITEKLYYYSGLDFKSSYSFNSEKLVQTISEHKTWNFTSGIGLIIGLSYKLNSDINISAEVVPSVLYSYGEIISSVNYVTSDEVHSGVNIGFGNQGAGITLSYRFH